MTNDDGIYTPAIAKLKQALNRRSLSSRSLNSRSLNSRKKNITVVAPDAEQSGVSHSITFNSPLMARKVFIDNKFFGYGVSGSPADCVKLAVRELMETPPNLIISGINMGANLGVHVLHSGTVAAAIEGAIAGIPSFAISLEYSDMPETEAAALFAAKMADRLVEHNLPKGTLLNVNIPARQWKEIKGIRVTKQYAFGLDERFDKHTDPNGQYFYWLANMSEPVSYEDDTDLKAVKDGYISITPICFDLTDHKMVEDMKGWNGDDDLLSHIFIDMK